MRFYNKKIFFNFRFLINKFNFLNNLNFKNLNYSVDTWKLLNIERILINLKDEIYKNNKWLPNEKINKNKPLFNFLNYIYILNFYTTILNFSLLSKNNFEFLNYLNNNYFYNFNNKKNTKQNKLLFNNIFYHNIVQFIKNIQFTNNVQFIKNAKINKINKIVFNFKNKIKKMTLYFIKNKINIILKANKNIFYFKPLVFYNEKNYNTFSLLKKQKIYTKNKYSRSRQYCKNIVLFGLLLNIILMFGLNSSYYAILINAGYFIYVFYFLIFLLSLFLFKKYKLLNLKSFL